MVSVSNRYALPFFILMVHLYVAGAYARFTWTRHQTSTTTTTTTTTWVNLTMFDSKLIFCSPSKKPTTPVFPYSRQYQECQNKASTFDRCSSDGTDCKTQCCKLTYGFDCMAKFCDSVKNMNEKSECSSYNIRSKQFWPSSCYASEAKCHDWISKRPMPVWFIAILLLVVVVIVGVCWYGYVRYHNSDYSGRLDHPTLSNKTINHKSHTSAGGLSSKASSGPAAFKQNAKAAVGGGSGGSGGSVHSAFTKGSSLHSARAFLMSKNGGITGSNSMRQLSKKNKKASSKVKKSNPSKANKKWICLSFSKMNKWSCFAFGVTHISNIRLRFFFTQQFCWFSNRIKTGSTIGRLIACFVQYKTCSSLRPIGWIAIQIKMVSAQHFSPFPFLMVHLFIVNVLGRTTLFPLHINTSTPK